MIGPIESGDARVKGSRGTVGPSVARIVGTRSDGTRVEASLSDDGHFLIWWPEVGDSIDLERLVTYDSDGESVDHWSAGDVFE